MLTLILAAARLILLALLGATNLVSDAGLSTRFGDPGDKLRGGSLFCTGERLDPEQPVCAHRSLPCGTVLMLHNPRTKRVAVCEVLDRGPFGARLANGKWTLKISRADPGVWRGVLDLSPAVARALGHNGKEPITYFHARTPRVRHVARTPHPRH
jgi:hypothetical protein